jgi:hypothetical protein
MRFARASLRNVSVCQSCRLIARPSGLVSLPSGCLRVFLLVFASACLTLHLSCSCFCPCLLAYPFRQSICWSEICFSSCLSAFLLVQMPACSPSLPSGCLISTCSLAFLGTGACLPMYYVLLSPCPTLACSPLGLIFLPYRLSGCLSASL